MGKLLCSEPMLLKKAGVYHDALSSTIEEGLGVDFMSGYSSN